METAADVSPQARIHTQEPLLTPQVSHKVQEEPHRPGFSPFLRFRRVLAGSTTGNNRQASSCQHSHRLRDRLRRSLKNNPSRKRSLRALRNCFFGCSGARKERGDEEDSDSTSFGTHTSPSQANTPTIQELLEVPDSNPVGEHKDHASSASQMILQRSSVHQLAGDQDQSTSQAGNIVDDMQEEQVVVDEGPETIPQEGSEIESVHEGEEQNFLTAVNPGPLSDSSQIDSVNSHYVHEDLLAVHEIHNQQLLDLTVRLHKEVVDKDTEFEKSVGTIKTLEQEEASLEETVRHMGKQMEEDNSKRGEEKENNNELINESQVYLGALNEERTAKEHEQEKQWKNEIAERMFLRMSTRLYIEEITSYQLETGKDSEGGTPWDSSQALNGDTSKSGKDMEGEGHYGDSSRSSRNGTVARHKEELKCGEIRDDRQSQASSPVSTTVPESGHSSSSPLTGFYVGGRYRIDMSIGSGDQAELFEGTDMKLQMPVTIKAEQRITTDGVSVSLHHENEVYRLLKTEESSKLGIPCVHYYEEGKHHNFLVMDQFGLSLSQLFFKRLGKIPHDTVFEIGIILVLQLEYIHARGVVHGDLKPANIVFGKNAWTTHIIDYGLSVRYLHEGTKDHVFNFQRDALYGTSRYASRHAHEKWSLSRRDDLESLGYILVELLRGSLPWKGNDWVEIGEKKNSCRDEELCDGLPTQMLEFLEYVKGLAFAQDPDYKRLCTILESAL